MATTSNQSPAYDITAPLPLGQAIRELPGQYLKVLTRPSVKTFAGEKGKAGWGIILCLPKGTKFRPYLLARVPSAMLPAYPGSA